ncbi:MAG: M50 family metallopeptidase [Bacteroidales bacterium]|nr:M50 family metallopeptidase [Bacteroidales bacterium]
MSQLLQNENLIFYAIFIVCGIGIFLPVIGKYVRLIETMIHEFGHVLLSLILGCPIKRVNLFSDTSGETIISAPKFKTILIALAGYPFASATSFIYFWANTHHYQRYMLYGLTILSVLFLLFYIRNLFGICWTISLIALNCLTIYIDNENLTNILSNIYACIIFIESNLSTLRLLVLAWKNGNKAGDAGVLYKETHIHAILYALIFVGFNIFISYYTIILFFPLNN